MSSILIKKNINIQAQDTILLVKSTQILQSSNRI